MTVLLLEAVQALDAVLKGLLPVAPNPAFAAELFVDPVTTQLVGIGGVVGLRTDPPGEVQARRVKARVVVRVKAPTTPELAAIEAGVSVALLGADPVGLRSRGVFRLARCVEGMDATLELSPETQAKDLRFDVLYEHVKQPVVGEGVIAELPIDLLRHDSDGVARTLLDLSFATDPLPLFDVIDDVGVAPLGQWQFEAVAEEIRQTSPARGGSDAFDADKRGTYLMLRAATVAALPRDFALYCAMRSDAASGIGLLFRFQDRDNHYFALLDGAGPFRMFGKKVAGTAAFLDSAGRAPALSYPTGRWLQVRLSVQGDAFELSIDGAVALQGRDASIRAPGRIGFLCRNNAAARFRGLRWVAL